MANRAQIFKKQSLVAISTQEPLMQSTLKEEACTKLPASCTKLSVCAVFMPYEPMLIKEFLGSYVNQQD